ncbi:hypothetical protein HHK36_013734 [Tetracentron sinense]|uniref:Glycosyltransferase N-terminal domain-containing protein n=1 Tax=Tetracentron sinense TaxID=13715 RepID=A0A834Z7M6_TETSI|nr:hypothetical protein HHK36_013734 [Tetracentron sinense]
MASQHHIVIFPFLAQGHTLPILDLSKALSCRGLKVTIITTPSNSPFIRLIISRYPEIHLREISFPLVEALPKGCENTAQLPSMDLLLPFLTATKQLQQPFEQALRDMSQVQDLPICVISDSYLGWTNTSCRAFNIPRLVFHGMGAFSMAVRKSLLAHQTHKHKSNTEPLCVPGVRLDFQLTKTDLPKSLREMDYDNPLSRFHLEAEESDLESWGVIINSFTELEKDHIASLESFYKNGAKAWCVGPFLLYEETMEGKEDPSRTWVEWLINKAVIGSLPTSLPAALLITFLKSIICHPSRDCNRL